MVAPERFRLGEDVLRTAASRTRRRLAVPLAAAAAVVVAVHLGALRPRGAGWRALVLPLALLAVLALATLRRRMRRLHSRWASFHVALDEAGLSSGAAGLPAGRVARADLASVEEGPQGLLVRGRAGTAVLVPRGIEGYERIRAVLAQWGRR